jgi:formylmethanofuran dehydrogenase subunit E
MLSLEELLAESTRHHGHTCPGQVLGVRMAVLGCQQVGIADPRHSKNLLVYVEIDRCMTDAIQSVTGCRLGKRTLKYVDYGKVAATFLNTATSQAVRVLARDDSRERSRCYDPPSADKKEAQLYAYQVMPDTELFAITPVHLSLPQEDLPGKPLSRVTCQGCGEGINDRREVEQGGKTLCRACAFGSYYQPLELGFPAAPGEGPPVVAIVGYSNSGKTRVASALVRILTNQGYRIAAIKHCPHGHQVDRPGSDSARLFDAGVTEVIISSPDQITRIQRIEADNPLEELVASLSPGYDLVIAEGFKGSSVPKVLIISGEPLMPLPRNVVAVVAESATDVGAPGYTFGEMESLARQLLEQIPAGQPTTL